MSNSKYIFLLQYMTFLMLWFCKIMGVSGLSWAMVLSPFYVPWAIGIVIVFVYYFYRGIKRNGKNR
jgi:hypothetical protein